MAVSNARTRQLRFFRFFMVSLCFFPIPFPSAASLSFNFIGFNRNRVPIYLERDAFVAPYNLIQLTRNLKNAEMVNSWGRATHTEQLHLWDKTSGNLTDFTANFTFVIDSGRNSSYGDGLTFFLCPNRSVLPSNITGGSGLGLVSDGKTFNPKANRFVAVEFDTYQNSWDPRDDHVGININSMKSLKNVSWFSNIPC